MKLIKQQGFADCGVAAIAMVTNVDYFRVLGSVPNDVFFFGLSYNELMRALFKVTKKDWAEQYFINEEIRLKDFETKHKPAILGLRCTTLKQFNYHWQFHYVATDGERIFDPREEKTFELDEVRKSEKGEWRVEAIIFQ